MKKCIAFHSYKGGTGKSTISANISVLLVQRGYNVLLIDMDVYAPTLQTYFSQEPTYWINNFYLIQLNLKTLFMILLV